jgi:hypothetical protein
MSFLPTSESVNSNWTNSEAFSTGQVKGHVGSWRSHLLEEIKRQVPELYGLSGLSTDDMRARVKSLRKDIRFLCHPDLGLVWGPWEPFDSEADFMLAQYMVEFGIGEGAMDHLLKTVLPSLGVHHAVRSVHAVKQRIDQMTDGLGHQSWSKNTTTMQWNTAHPAPIEFYSRDILRCARWLLEQPAYEDDLVYAPERHFNDAGSRIYGEMHTGDWWWEQKVCPRARRTAHVDRGLVCAARGGYGGAARFHVRRDPSDQLRGRQEGLAGLYDHRQPLPLGSQSVCHAERAIGRLAAGPDQVAGCRGLPAQLAAQAQPHRYPARPAPHPRAAVPL